MRFLDLICIATVAALAAAGTAHAQPAIKISATSTPAASAAGTLTLSFTGMDAKRGRIMLALHDEAGWAGGKPVRVAMVDVTTGEASVAIADLPAGRCGVKAFHDVNGNGKMDANPFGMPTEPFAFSNNAKGRMGPATWEDAKFAVERGINAHSITIR